MFATIPQALILEVLPLEFTKTQDGKPDEVIQYYRLVIYEFGQKYPASKQIKLPSALVEDAKALVGKKADIKVTLFQKKDKLEMIFQGVA